MAETNMHTTGSLSPAIVASYLSDTMLERSELSLVFWKIAQKYSIPKGQGKTIEFHRFERLPLPTAPLDEGTTPTATPLLMSSVQATVDQWGAVASFTDMAEMTIKHPVIQIGRDLLSEQHDQVIDREVQVVCMAGSSVMFPNAVTARSGLGATDVIASDTVRMAVARLNSLGARPFDRGLFRGVVDSLVWADLTADATFIQAGTNSQVRTLRMSEIGEWMGVNWDRSNYIPAIAAQAAANVTQAVLTGGAIPAGATGFAAASTVRNKVTALDPATGFETVIDTEVATTDAAIFCVQITIAAAAPTGVYRVYSSLQGGAAGTPTLQGRVNHTTGTASAIVLCRAGAPVGANVWVVTGTGPVAPPDAPAVTVHISYIFGQQAIGAAELSSAGLETYLTPKAANQADPLAQRRYIGWKRAFKACILNTNYFRRIESASNYSA